MSDPLSRIKSDILAERKQTGKIDREAWLTRHPEMAETLPAVFRLIDRVVEAEALEPTAAWSDYQGIATRARENLRRIEHSCPLLRSGTSSGHSYAPGLGSISSWARSSRILAKPDLDSRLFQILHPIPTGCSASLST